MYQYINVPTYQTTEVIFILNEAAREARRAYKRAWNKANPDKVKAAQERYWTRKAEQAEAEAHSNDNHELPTTAGR